MSLQQIHPQKQPLPTLEQPLRKATWMASQFNLTKSTIGAGLLFLPDAFMKAGWVNGLVLCLFIGFLSISSHKFLSEAGAWMKCRSYRDLIKTIFGRPGEYIYVALVTLMLLGPITAYFKLAAVFTIEAIHGYVDVAPGSPWVNSWFISALFGVILMFPLSCVTPISRLSNVSFLGLLVILYGFFLIVIKSGLQIRETGNVATAASNWTFELLISITTIGFAYANHYIYLDITSEMENPTAKRNDSLLFGSNLFCVLIYSLIGILGYMAFGVNTAENIFFNMVGHEVAICRIGFAIMLALSYPLCIDPCRRNVIWLIETSLNVKPHQKQIEVGNGWVQSYSRIFSEGWLFYTVTIVIMLLSYTLANVFPQVTLIFGIFFSLAGGVIVFILPAVMWWVVGQRMEYYELSNAGKTSPPRWAYQRWCLKKSTSTLLASEPVEVSQDADYDAAVLSFPLRRSTFWSIWAILSVLFGIFVFFVGTGVSVYQCYVKLSPSKTVVVVEL